MPTDHSASLSRCANTPDADRMVVSASTETHSSPSRPPPLTSPGQACSSTFSEAEVVVEEESTRATSLTKGLLSCSRCGVHLEYGKHTPLMLPGCLHTICQTCAEHYNNASEIQCKLCLCPSTGTVEHSLVQALLKRQHVQQQQSRFCGQCVERGARVQTCGVCVDCDIDLCADCVQAHQRTKATWSHKIDFCDSSSDEARCTEHRKVFDNYCDTCRTIGCGDCILSAHRSHESSTLEVKAQQIKVAIQAKAQELSELRQYATDMKTTMQQRLAEATEEKAKGVSNVTKHYERYQEVVRSFFQSQRETAEHSYDSHFQSIFNCLNAAGFMDSRLGHASNFISNLLDVDQPLLLVKNAKHVYSCTSRLKGVKLEVPSSNLPSIDMRRVLGIDRIEDMMSLLLYDKDACLQPELKMRLARSFMSLSQQIMSHLLLSNSDYSAVFLRSLFETMLEMPTMSKQMFDMISLFHTEMRKRFHVSDPQPPVSDGSGSLSQQLPYVNNLPALSAVSPPAAFLESVSITACELIGTDNAQNAVCSAAVQQLPLVADQQTNVQHKQQQQHQQQQQLQQQQQRGSLSQQYHQQQQQHPINTQQQQQQAINLQQRQQHPINLQQRQHTINTQQQQQHPINTQQQQHLHVQQQQQPQYPINPQQLRVQQQQQHHVASQQQPRSHIQQQQRLQHHHQQQTVLNALLTGNNPPMTTHMQQDSPVLSEVLQTVSVRQNPVTQVLPPELMQRQQWAQHMQRTGSACSVAQHSVVTPSAAVPTPTAASTFSYNAQPHTVHYAPQPQVSQYRPQRQPPPLQYQQHQRYRQPSAGMTAFPQPGRSTNDEKVRALMATEHNRTRKNQKRASGGHHASGDQASCTPLAQQLPPSSAVLSAVQTAPAPDPVVAPASNPSGLEASTVLGSPMLEEDSGFSFKWHNPLTPSPAQPRREIQVPQQFRIQIGAKRMHVDEDVSDDQDNCAESTEASQNFPTSTAAASALAEKSAPGKKPDAGRLEPLRISECVSLPTGDKEPDSPADRPTVGKSPTQLLDDIDKVLAEINSNSGSSTEKTSDESSVNQDSGRSMPTALQLDAPVVSTDTNSNRTAPAGMSSPTRASSSPSCEVVSSIGHSSAAVGSPSVVAKVEKTSELTSATPVLNRAPLPSVAQGSSTTVSTAVTSTATMSTPLAALTAIMSDSVQRSTVSSGQNVLPVLTSQSVSNLPIAVLPSQLVVSPSPIAVQPVPLQSVVPFVLSTQSTSSSSSQVAQKRAARVCNLSSPPQLLPLNEATMARPHAGSPPSGTSVSLQLSGGSLSGTGSVSRLPPPLKVKPNLVASTVVSCVAQPAKGSEIASPMIVTPYQGLLSLTEDTQPSDQTEKRHSSADEALGISKSNQGESPRKRRRSLGVPGSNRLVASGSFKKSKKRPNLSIAGSQSNTTLKFPSKGPNTLDGAPSECNSETPYKGASETLSKGDSDATSKDATENTSKGALGTPKSTAKTSQNISGAENPITNTAVERPREVINKSVAASARSPVVAGRAQSGFTRPPTGTRTTSETGHKPSASTITASAESLGVPTTTDTLTESVPQTPTRISHVPSGTSKTPSGTPRTPDTPRSQHSISAGTKQSTSDHSSAMTDSAPKPTEADHVIADTPRTASSNKYSSAKRVSVDSVKRAATLPTHPRHWSSEKSLVSPPRPPGATPPNRFLLNRPRGGQTGARTASLHTQSSVRLDEWGHKISRAGVSIDTPIDSLLHSMVAGTASKEHATSVAVAHHPPTTDKMILDHCAPKRFLPEGTETSVGVRLLMKEPKEIDAGIEVSAIVPKTLQLLGASISKDNQTGPKVKKKCWKDETAKKDGPSVDVEDCSQKDVGSDADKLTEVASKSASVVPLKSGTSSRGVAPSETSKHREKSGSKSPEQGLIDTALQSQIKSKPHTLQQSDVQQGVRQSFKSKKRQSDHSRSSKGRSSPEGTNSSHSDDSVSKQSFKKVSASNKNSNVSSHKSKHGISHKRKNSSDSSDGGKSSKKRHVLGSSKSRSRHSTAELAKGKCSLSSITESTEGAMLRASPRSETSGDVSPGIQEPVDIEPSDADAVLPKRTSTGGRWKRLRIDSSSDEGEMGSMPSALALPRDLQLDNAPTAAAASAEPSCLSAPLSPLPVHLARLPPGGRADLDWDKQGDPLGIGLHPELLYQPPQRRCESPNISFCALCWDGGDLVLCDYCDKSYHSACYFGPMDEHSDGGDTQWQCLMCLPMAPPRDPDVAAKEEGMNEYEKLLATRLLLELYAAYYPALYFRNLENMSKLSEFSAIPDAISLDCVREGLRQDEFHSLMHFLRALKKLMDQANYLEKGKPPHRYLRELDEVFEDFVRNYMNKYWFQLDDNSQ